MDRCDGRHPCTTCSAAGEECLYGTKALPKSRGDLILEVALRSERLLHEMKAELSNVSGLINASNFSNNNNNNNFSAPNDISPWVLPSPATVTSMNRGDMIENAMISTLQTCTTQEILTWPHFNQFPSLQPESRSVDLIFQLESSRPQLPERTSFIYPYATTAEIDKILDAFQRNVNFWYPTMSLTRLMELRTRLISGGLNSNTDSCLALLVMALGCASGLVESECDYASCSNNMSDIRRPHRIMSEVYFDGAMKMIHRAFMDMTTDAAQCLFFAALFFAFLQRPLQAWSFLTNSAKKCQLILSYPISAANPTETECVRRIFWSCYILESDYLAELSALPQSGIADIESSVPLPGEYYTQKQVDSQEQSSLYFLACISMRRLLNRVHHLLYAKDTGASIDDARFPSIVAELSHQLDDWRELLPPPLQFSLDNHPTTNALGGFLRQRYLTCQSIIFRPYLMWALANCTGNKAIPPAVLEGCEHCLDACILHILNLRSFPHTVMFDTWICALSMASAMLILLAASQLPVLLQPNIASRATLLGPHLEQLLRTWMHIPGASVSPSVEHSVRLIKRVDNIFKQMLPPSPQESLSNGNI
ncbi:putative C6 transcription factor [Patellaria atrata CBS 101060]|uniref:C6 transcription factor n=1 Tax=Patellaria atrata CBS 101060 TaxID=1346257 RepID=A0A9P4S5P9_9PEZI|nr:putative C6 transcription factor [Patellaria atrata CBS 101060]